MVQETEACTGLNSTAEAEVAFSGANTIGMGTDGNMTVPEGLEALKRSLYPNPMAIAPGIVALIVPERFVPLPEKVARVEGVEKLPEALLNSR